MSEYTIIINVFGEMLKVLLEIRMSFTIVVCPLHFLLVNLVAYRNVKPSHYILYQTICVQITELFKLVEWNEVKLKMHSL